MSKRFDVVVVGAGPAGEIVAQRAAAGGLSTALVEKELLGGECSYWACMPSKALLRPSEVHRLARAMPGVRELLAPGGVRAEAVLAWRDQKASHWDDAGQLEWAEGAKVSVVRGRGRLAGERRVQVEGPEGTQLLEAQRAVVLATGSRARVPEVPGLRDARPWTNREATAAKRVPRRLLVVGGGAVGVELAQAWRCLGSEVRLVHRGAHLLERLEPFASRAVARALTDEGVRLHLGCTLKEVRREGSGEVVARLDDGFEVRADELLLALGREPATQDLGLESVGLTPGKPVEVDDSLRARGVAGGWLYACGDVNGRTLLTHMGKYQAHVLGEVLQGRPARAWADARAVPQVLFTHPEVASVGLTEAAARKAGHRVRCAEVALESAAGTGLLGEGAHGHAKWVVDEERRVLLGVTLVGPGVGELLHAATVAVAGELPLETLWHAVPAFPTVSEVWLRLLEASGL
ncbi:NAD(P)/FAD-dependent oxidoreductase [Aggregicoccus sp. 17bor-14]|uniref:dihydrolipoyl dehydrogenase family protein n=1 Tax=Myxococcaceae TaxID=31 RepID=UPI0012F34E73|nr:NAD(P)/FAD-dependent oxidoreductase [Simulacricoccus sp. 17bor-14]MRI91946.1 NAD(P)/FAD-dependent oxidoreductase [Aggregicoccus sp. 17bor-14]